MTTYTKQTLPEFFEFDSDFRRRYIAAYNRSKKEVTCLWIDHEGVLQFFKYTVEMALENINDGSWKNVVKAV